MHRWEGTGAPVDRGARGGSISEVQLTPTVTSSAEPFVRSQVQEGMQRAQAALKQSKQKNYYKILGACAGQMLKTRLVQRALQHSILKMGCSALDRSWCLGRCGARPEESVQSTPNLASTAHFDRRVLCAVLRRAGVPRDATKRQIKKAYRDLALKYHPDKQKTDAEREEVRISYNMDLL